jgi:hypothetical protein
MLKQTLHDALAKKASPAEDNHLSWCHVLFLAMQS